jgi:hypothetical protein
MQSAADTEPFFRRDGDLIVPLPHSGGPWDDSMMNGRNVAAIIAWAIEREHGDEELVCARFTVDMLRPVPMEPLTISSRRTREGGRLRAVSAEVTAAGKLVATANAIMLRKGEQPPDSPWRAPEWDMPHPDALAALVSPEVEKLMMDVRPEFEGVFFAEGQRRLWFRDTLPLVEGEAWTPFVRAVAVGDLTNPLANRDRTMRFINADVNVYLSRYPIGEWIGMEVLGHVSADGVCVGSCALHDTRGRIGWSTVAGLGTPGTIQM